MSDKTYTSAAEIPEGTRVRFNSEYIGWYYVNGVINMAMIDLGEYQNGKGLWHQLLDKSDSYEESSCTSMFTYCTARAVNEGWIHRSYATIALAGWEGLKANMITFDGQLKSVCIGTGIRDDLVFYYNRPARTNEAHGLGAVIEAGIEIMKLKKSQNMNR